MAKKFHFLADFFLRNIISYLFVSVRWLRDVSLLPLYWFLNVKLNLQMAVLLNFLRTR